jgi:hypothetical protein
VARPACRFQTSLYLAHTLDYSHGKPNSDSEVVAHSVFAVQKLRKRTPNRGGAGGKGKGSIDGELALLVRALNSHPGIKQAGFTVQQVSGENAAVRELMLLHFNGMGKQIIRDLLERTTTYLGR